MNEKRLRRLTSPIVRCLAALTLLLAATASTGAIAAPAAAGSTGTATTATLAASGVVNKLHGTILESMKGADEMGYQGRYDKLAPVMTETFDLDYMARKSVGRSWKNLDDAEQQLWLETFARLIIANYAGQFNDYSGEHFETLGEDPSIKKTVLVRTKLVLPGDDDLELNYRMRSTPDGWRIIDVYMKGTVSELALRRSEYTELLKSKGFEKLVSLLNDKVAKLGDD